MVPERTSENPWITGGGVITGVARVNPSPQKACCLVINPYGGRIVNHVNLPVSALGVNHYLEFNNWTFHQVCRIIPMGVDYICHSRANIAQWKKISGRTDLDSRSTRTRIIEEN